MPVHQLFRHRIELLTLMEKELKSLSQKWVVRVCKALTRGNIFYRGAVTYHSSSHGTSPCHCPFNIYLFLCVVRSFDEGEKKHVLSVDAGLDAQSWTSLQ